MQIRNYMEDIVSLMVKKVLLDIDCCTCNKCIMDISAIALNNLPPKYVVTRTGETFMNIKELQSQFEVDVVAAISNAAKIVKNNPKHEVE